MKYYLAIDIGASSGRGIIGYKENGELVTDEVYRFENSVESYNGHLIWNIDKLYLNVLDTIKAALSKYEIIESMSIDTWGVDYCLLDKDLKEIKPCYAYRDSRTKRVIDKVHDIISFNELYSITGSQFQEFNTIYQLYDDKLNGRLNDAFTFLQIPSYLMFKLTGVLTQEYTNASTTGLLDGDSLSYSKVIIDRLGLNEKIFMDLKKPGFVLEDFKSDVRDYVKGNIKVKLCATHDTGSAVEGIPFNDNNPYISSGTWSLLGIKIDKTIRTKEAMESNYSNEYGKDYIRFQKNIMGLWIAQCLNKETGVSHSEMSNLAYSSNYNEIFDCNLNRFLSPKNMKEEIINYFKENDRILPNNDADIFRCVYRSLAYSYKVALDELERITGKSFDKVYIVGGGAKNKFLNEVTKEITNRNVVAIPIEATAIGNLLSQMEE